MQAQSWPVSSSEFYWTSNVEALRFYGGFIAMQATPGPPCTPATE